MGVPMEMGSDYIITSKSDNLKPIKIKTQGYPGFATDLQQPITTLLTQCNGVSELEETIYENRFQNVPFLNKMGANIEINKTKIKVNGKTNLKGEEVEATDLRAGACMILAGLTAEGTTKIINVEHVLRGYENLIEKLNEIGADVKLIEE